MRLRFLPFQCALALFSLLTCTAQTSSTVSKNFALTTLSESTLVTGWNPQALPTDITLTGTATIYGDDEGEAVSKVIIIKALGRGRVRYEHPDQPSRTTIIDRGANVGMVGRQLIPNLAFTDWNLPLLAEFIDFSEPNVRLEYLGNEGLAEPSYKIRMYRVAGSPEVRIPGTELKIWISVKTFLPLQVEFQRAPFTSPTAFAPYVRKYGDFRRVGALLFPFAQEEWAGTQKLSSFQFSSLILDSGLSAAEFAIPSAGGQ